MTEAETIRWFDNHCHLTTAGADPTDPTDPTAGQPITVGERALEIVTEAAAAGVAKLLTVGCTVADSRAAIATAMAFDSVYATAGVHPHDAKSVVDGPGPGEGVAILGELEALLIDPATAHKVRAVGECGLDYYYDHSPRPIQRQVFAHQVDLAHRHDLALVIHTRDAWADTFAVLDDVGTPTRTVFHCFTGGPAEATEALNRGAYLSFSGIVTFPRSTEVQAAARIVPGDRVLIETDAPYLTPVPHRGQPNRPALVPLVGKKIAELTGREIAEIAHLTWENGLHLYGA